MRLQRISFSHSDTPPELKLRILKDRPKSSRELTVKKLELALPSESSERRAAP
jgi:hypothetical protein